MRRIALLILIVLVLPLWIANGQEIYRWVDEKGTVHFADDFTLVPEKYRDQIQKRKPPEEPSPSPARPPSRPEATAPTAESTPPKKDLWGRGEEWWRAKMKEWNEKLQNAQKNYDLIFSNLKQKEKELTDALFKPDSLKRKLKAEIKELEGKLKEREKERDEAKNMVENALPKQAADDNADPAWLKPKD
ncbi:MAG: DUF4124 domain-containing protein [Deltaproteobacteria bacterium]|nr:DUF4124 domain-containing protein [Deltaproteobacteria bacterium]